MSKDWGKPHDVHTVRDLAEGFNLGDTIRVTRIELGRLVIFDVTIHGLDREWIYTRVGGTTERFWRFMSFESVEAVR